MKQRLLTGLLAVSMAAVSAWGEVPATRLITENFDYAANTNLYGTDGSNGWLEYGTTTASPIQVKAGNLVLKGYSDPGLGNKVYLTGATNSEKLFKVLPDSKSITSGSLYAAMLINMESASTEEKPSYFFNFVVDKNGGLNDKTSTNEYGRLFAFGTKGNEKTYKLGITRFKAADNAIKADMDLEYGKTYLIVLKYEIVDGTTNDKVSLFVNPSASVNEPAATVVYGNNGETDGDISNKGIRAVLLRQGTATNYSNVYVDALRVATSWAGLFDASEEKTPAITVSSTSFGYDPTLAGLPQEALVSVGGVNLKGDITIECSEGVKSSVASIAKDAEGIAEGVNVTFTSTPNPAETGEWKGTATLKSEGADDVVITFDYPQVIVPIR